MKTNMYLSIFGSNHIENLCHGGACPHSGDFCHTKLEPKIIFKRIKQWQIKDLKSAGQINFEITIIVYESFKNGTFK